MAALGFVLAVILMKRKTAASLLITMTVITILGLFVTINGSPVTPHPETLLSLPPSPVPVIAQIDWLYPFRHWETVWLAMITLFFVDLFDSVGTLIGVSRRADLVDGRGNLPRMNRALAADAGATAMGAVFGTSTTTAFIESATGVEAGGKTGFTGVVVAGCFLAALFLHPLIAIIPAAAVAPALLIVGILMSKGITQIGGESWQAQAGAIAIAVLIPLNFQIAEGIAAGCVIYTALMIFSGQSKKVHWFLKVLSALFVTQFAFEIFG
jgi:AGZA family xanthine/uracil permease-like MFS transporter